VTWRLVNKTKLVHNFSCMFIYILYMFRVTMCPSSGEILYFCNIWYLSLCVDDLLVCRMGFHPAYQIVIQSDKYQVSHWYSYFSWWWAHSFPKHVENRNKHTRKIVHQVGLIYRTTPGYTFNKTPPKIVTWYLAIKLQRILQQ